MTIGISKQRKSCVKKKKKSYESGDQDDRVGGC